jgi:hypothetical protein
VSQISRRGHIFTDVPFVWVRPGISENTNGQRDSVRAMRQHHTSPQSIRVCSIYGKSTISLPTHGHQKDGLRGAGVRRGRWCRSGRGIKALRLRNGGIVAFSARQRLSPLPCLREKFGWRTRRRSSLTRACTIRKFLSYFRWPFKTNAEHKFEQDSEMPPKLADKIGTPPKSSGQVRFAH